MPTPMQIFKCYNLKDVKYSREIRNSLNFKWSPLLTTESLLSILSHLSKDPSIVNGKQVLLTPQSIYKIQSHPETLREYTKAINAGWDIPLDITTAKNYIVESVDDGVCCAQTVNIDL